MKQNNNNFHKAKRVKDDEFYTLRKDIDAELRHYERHFNGSVVYCNCDTADSNFVKYFKDNADRLGLAGFLYSWNDFRSPESVELLKEADIVVTNPPFSLFRDYVAQLVEHNKQFLIVGPMTAIQYKEIFPLLKDNKMWLGVGKIKDFSTPDGTTKGVGCNWFTNMPHKSRNESIILHRKYTPEDYPKYDNYNAIEVSKVADIPEDFDGYMGVPITFMCRFNPYQFEILGLSQKVGMGLESTKFYDGFVETRQDGSLTGCSGRKTNGNPVMQGRPQKGNYYVNGKEIVHSLYARIFIRNRKIGAT